METFTLNINGSDHTVQAQPTTPLLLILREQLRLTGAKPGCGEGQCGACTVLIAGRPVRSCLTTINEVGGQPVRTIEGLAQDGRLHPVQQAFLDFSAFQCGYCTPGMIMAAVGLLHQNPHPTAKEIRTELGGNVCRCGTYSRIIQAIQRAASEAKHV